MALGGLRAVRQVAPDARLAVLSRPAVADVFRVANVADEILAVERRSWRDTARTVRQVRSGGYDAAVLFQNAFEAALVARLARVRRIVGYPTDGRRYLLTDAIPLEREHAREHQSRYYMRIAAGFEQAILGTLRIDVERPDTSLVAPESSRERAAAILAACGAPSGAPVAVLNAGATNSRAKQWPPDRFASVGDALVERSGGIVALVGSAGDVEVSRRVAGAMRRRDRAVVVAGRTSVFDLVGLLGGAWAAVSNDTGTAHVAAALGVPTVTIFGPTEEFATHPVGSAAQIVRRPVECSPCMMRDCPIDHRCMIGVSVDEVLGAVEASVARAGRMLPQS
jgi:heptosyltransferase-2